MSDADGEFTDFVRTHSPALLRTAFYLTGDPGLAEDLLQTTLTKVYLHWSKIDSRTAAPAYARRTMINTATSWWRRFSWHKEKPRDDVPDLHGPDEYADMDERAHLLATLRRLPARQRAVVALRFLEDLSEAETARLLGCTPGTVKSQTSRALTRLRQDLTADYYHLVEEDR
jgi:RNA polymerase sigma-70 factor (sigma-E family)